MKNAGIINFANPKILGTKVYPTTYRQAADQIMKWALSSQSRYVCVANVHMVMEAYDDSDFKKVVNNADMITPDGMPLVWLLRMLGYPLKDRVCGPVLTMWVLEEAACRGVPVGFYGGAPEVLENLIENMQKKFPNLMIDFQMSPPFRELTPQEEKNIINKINLSGIKILFVGLGCPKQEKWMAKHKDCLNCVMLGVGAAFDFHSGKIKQAPEWMQTRGLEWLFRLLMEPRRLWKRYLKHNSRFAALAIVELFKKF